MTQNNIDLIIYNDKLHRPLLDIYFKPSFDRYLSSNFNLIDVSFETSATDGSYASEHWCDVISNRFDILKEYISRNINTDKIAVFSDIDIIFFDNIYKDILNKFNQNIDICYMAENTFCPKFLINGGFFAFRCSLNVLNFFDTIQRITKNSKERNDQPVIQEYFQNNRNINIKYDIFNPIYFCTNNNPKYVAYKLLGTCKVFHATSTTNLIEKCQVMSTFTIKKQILQDQSMTEDKNLWLSR